MRRSDSQVDEDLELGPSDGPKETHTRLTCSMTSMVMLHYLSIIAMIYGLYSLSVMVSEFVLLALLLLPLSLANTALLGSLKRQRRQLAMLYPLSLLLLCSGVLQCLVWFSVIPLPEVTSLTYLTVQDTAGRLFGYEALAMTGSMVLQVLNSLVTILGTRWHRRRLSEEDWKNKTIRIKMSRNRTRSDAKRGAKGVRPGFDRAMIKQASRHKMATITPQ